MARTNNVPNVYSLPKNNYWDTRIKPRLDEVRKWCAEGYTESQIALKLGMTPSVFSKYKLSIPVLKDLVSRGRTEAVHNVENALYKLCMGYRYTRTKEVEGAQGTKTEIIEEVVPPNVTAIQYFLNNRASDKWRASAQAGNNTTNVQANIQQNNYINKDGSAKNIGREELKKILGKFDNEFMIIGSADGKEAFPLEGEFMAPEITDKDVEDNDFSVIGGLPLDDGTDYGGVGKTVGLKEGEYGLGDTDNFDTEPPPEFEVNSGLTEEVVGVKKPGVDDAGEFGEADEDFKEALKLMDDDFVVEEVKPKTKKRRML